MQLVAASSGHSPSSLTARRPSGGAPPFHTKKKIKSSVNRGRVNRPLELWMDVNGRGTFPSDCTPFIRSLRFSLASGPFNSILSVCRATVWPCLWVADSSPPRQIATVSVHAAIHSIYANFSNGDKIQFFLFIKIGRSGTFFRFERVAHISAVGQLNDGVRSGGNRRRGVVRSQQKPRKLAE